MGAERKNLHHHAIVFLAAFVFLAAGGFLLSGIFSQDIEQFYLDQMRIIVNDTRDQGKQIAKMQKQEEELFDEINTSKARFAVHAIHEDQTFSREDSWTKALRDRLDCTNLYLLGARGKTIAKSEDTGIDFYRVRYSQFRTVFSTGKPSKAFSVTGKDGKTVRYYGVKINDSSEAVVEQDDKTLRELQKKTGDWETILKPGCLSPNSYAYVVSDLTGNILYDTRGSEPTDTIESYGLEAESLKDGQISGKHSSDAEYTGTVYLEDQKAYVCYVVPKADIQALQSRVLICLLLLAGGLFAAVILCRSRKHALKTAFAGSICIVIFAFAASALFALSAENYKEMIVGQRQETIQKHEADLYNELMDYHNQEYLTLMKAASEILGRHEAMRSRAGLKAINDALGTDYLMLYNNDMEETVTSGDYVNLNLSKEPDDPFYALSDLRFGVAERFWGPAEDPITGSYHEYIGVALRKNDNPDGFLLGSVIPGLLFQKEEIPEADEPDENGTKVMSDGENSADKVFVVEEIGQKDDSGSGEQAQEEEGDALPGSAEDNTSAAGETRQADQESIPEEMTGTYASRKSSEEQYKKAFEAMLIIGGWVLLGLALIIFLKMTFKLEDAEENGSRTNYFTSKRVLNCLAIIMSALAAIWVLFPESSLPEWSSLRGIVEEFFYGKTNYYPAGRELYSHGPGLSALTASLLAGGLIFLAIKVIQLLSGLITAASGIREGQKVRAACRMVEMILVIALLGIILYFFGVPVRVTGLAAVLLIMAIGFGGNTVIGDLAGGIWALMAGIIRQGDLIEAGGQTGAVEAIHLTHTVLSQEDGGKAIIGNRALVGRGLRIMQAEDPCTLSGTEEPEKAASEDQ